MAVNCFDTEAAWKIEAGVMGTSASRFAEPYPASYTVRPSWLAAAEHPGPSFELQSAKTRSRLARVGALGVCARAHAAVTVSAAAVIGRTRMGTCWGCERRDEGFVG